MDSFTVSVLFVLSICSISAMTTEEEEICDRYYQAFVDVRENMHYMFDGMRRGPNDYMKRFEVATGIDLDDEEALRTAACKVAESRTVEDIAEALNLNPEWAKVVYKQYATAFKSYMKRDMAKFEQRYPPLVMTFIKAFYNIAVLIDEVGLLSLPME